MDKVLGYGRLLATLAATLIVALLCAAPASADHNASDLPWPQALPALPVPTDVQPHGIKNCRRASLACVDDLMRRLEAQWRPLDAACDHRALFSYAYLQITKGIRDDLARPTPNHFPHKRWFEYVVTTFSNRYFEAFSNYETGKGHVPGAWRVTFDAARSGDANAGQDILLASNAHTQHDLPYVYAEQGMRTRDGRSRKSNHDGVNAINSAVFDHLQDEFAKRYDPFFGWIDMKPSPLDEMGPGELVKAWREGAWRNAERLMRAKTPEQRKRVERQIEATSTAWAHFIATPTMPGYRALRDGHCRAFHATG